MADELNKLADLEMSSGTGALAEAIKDLRRAGMLDAAELLERKTMPETVAIFKENAALRAREVIAHMAGQEVESA